MPNQEQQNNDAGVTHRATGKTCDLIIALTLILHWAGLLVQNSQRVRGMDMQDRHGQETTAQDP